MSTTSLSTEALLTPTSAKNQVSHHYCNLPITQPRVLSRDVNPRRLELIRVMAHKWVNGTVLHYSFMDNPPEWKGADDQKQVVRKAFETWHDLKIGISFQEVSDHNDAEIRIGFQQGDGSWSYIGREILDQGRDDRTMNFGWDLRGEIDTAIHEIGHTLGFPHEHQNPKAGIVWNEGAVYASLAASPNFWSKETTFHNIIEKIKPDTIQGSSWDSNSIMEYPFEAGLIQEPERYRNGLQPAGGLSNRDKEWVRTFYPPLAASDYQVMTPFISLPLKIAAGQQVNLTFTPEKSRKYRFGTFGTSDTVMVLFAQESDGKYRYLEADDDSGDNRNALIERHLLAGHKYVLRVRLSYADNYDETAAMVW